MPEPPATTPASPRRVTGGPPDYARLTEDVKSWGMALGFQRVGVARVDLAEDEARLLSWLAKGRHGEMHYMQRHGTMRARPGELHGGTIRIVSVRMDYLPDSRCPPNAVLDDPELGYVSVYAQGRDYHKLMRKRLQRLADRIEGAVGPFGYRAFVDSAPVMEKALARNAGLGWIGKHTNLIGGKTGSWFFLGELFTNLPLTVDAPASDHCGSCTACIPACPTGAIVAPYELDARLCISYLTIELAGAIPLRLRPLMGNRIFGCDDCQLVCPWNRRARLSAEPDFSPRQDLDSSQLTTLFAWSEAEFEQRTAGSAIRRIGHVRWLRNIAVALGNAPSSERVSNALRAREHHPSPVVREHVAWALSRHAAGREQRQ